MRAHTASKYEFLFLVFLFMVRNVVFKPDYSCAFHFLGFYVKCVGGI